jgi:YD repeat-containing protein
MRKYAPLKHHLERRNGRPEILSFEDIEDIIGAPLPKSAAAHRSFWANDARGHHSHARAWIGAGYRVAWVDRGDRVVRFERTR